MTPLPPTLPGAFLARPIAHRGLHGPRQPETSRAAVRAAVERGYGVEVDLQLAADGVPVAFHDEGLTQLTGVEGPVTGRTAAELAALPLLGGDGGADGGIPTFAEVLALVAGRVPLLVEVKDQDGTLGPRVGALEEAAARAVRGYEGPLAFMSFNPHSVVALRDLAPDVPRGLVTAAFEPEVWAPVPAATCDRLREIPDYEAAGACFVSHEARDLARARVAELKAMGARVLAWTIRSAQEERRARLVADNVTFEGYLA